MKTLVRLGARLYWRANKRFVAAFAEAVLGYGDGEFTVDGTAIAERLDVFLAGVTTPVFFQFVATVALLPLYEPPAWPRNSLAHAGTKCWYFFKSLFAHGRVPRLEQGKARGLGRGDTCGWSATRRSRKMTRSRRSRDAEPLQVHPGERLPGRPAAVAGDGLRAVPERRLESTVGTESRQAAADRVVEAAARAPADGRAGGRQAEGSFDVLRHRIGRGRRDCRPHDPGSEPERTRHPARRGSARHQRSVLAVGPRFAVQTLHERGDHAVEGSTVHVPAGPLRRRARRPSTIPWRSGRRASGGPI